MADEVATTKGTILRSLLKFVAAELTSEQHARMLAALRPEDRTIATTSVLASSKVPETALNHITAAAAAARGEALEAFGRRAGHAELRDAVGVYRFLTMVLTPTALLRKASTLWSAVHSHGSLEVQEGEQSARLRLFNFPSEPAHCARLSGWFEGAGKMTGAKDTSVIHDVCLCRGGPDCQWQLTWRK